ncbi:MAG TPA: enoyl-CoA hydratase/isomerase family protein [Solirubrobacterales bacterium]|nr:enoyl-CoA hydratase/isomerase family protein [Solirubrobacterales bacterium]
MWKVEESESGVVVARFERPPMSYYTDEDIGQLEGLVAEWTRRQVPAVVLAGGVEGRFITHFEVDGILLKQVEPEGPIESPVRSRRIHVLTQEMNKAPMPILAALNGDAMGVGFELALSSDIRVGERADHRYGLIETRLGIVPGGTGLTRMARLIGPGKAMLLGAGARALTPQEAYDFGLVELLVDDALATAVEVAERMATLPRAAVAMAKKIVYQSQGVPLSVALEFELDSAYRAKQSPEAAPALRDYLSRPLEQRRAWFER